jgi:hypothetical protein
VVGARAAFRQAIDSGHTEAAATAVNNLATLFRHGISRHQAGKMGR